MSKETGKFIPKTYHPRSSNYNELNQQRLGTFDYDINFDNEFQEFKLAIKFVAETMEAIKQEIIPIKKYEKEDLIPDEVAIDRMDKIWYGGCKYAVTYNENETQVLQKVFCYDDPGAEINGMPVHKIIAIPKLRNMVPVREIREETWGIQIKERYPLRWAWEGATYETVVNDANFSHLFAEGKQPMIEPQDMYSETKYTYILHRPVYFSLMNDLTKFFRKNENIFLTNMQKINKWMEGIGQMEVFSEFMNEDTSKILADVESKAKENAEAQN